MINTLEFFRVIAFVAVFMHHLSYGGSIGVIGVTLFIVLSGFIFAYNNFSRFGNLVDMRKIGSFYLSRLIRIYPVYILTFIISLPIVYFSKFQSSVLDAIINILMLQSWYPSGIQIFSFNGVSWFISDIVFFSLVTPFILIVLRRSKITKSIPKLMFFSFILWGFAVLVTFKFKGQMTPYTFGWWFIYTSPYFRLFDYLIGLVAGLICVNIREAKVFAVVSKGKLFFSLMEVLSLIGFLMLYRTPYFKFDSIIMSVYYTPGLVLLIMVFSFQQGVLSSVINNSLSCYLGRLTYSAYMVHYLVISYIIVLFLPSIQGPTGDLKHFVAQGIVLIIVFCASDVIYHHWELPSKRFLAQHLQKKRKTSWEMEM